MGASLEHLLAFNAKGMGLENKCMYNKSSSNNGSLWSKVLVAQSLRRRRERKQRVNKRVLMKRRVLLEGTRIPIINGVEKKVKTLKKLVPNGKSAMGLDGLFRDTADYILTLQMQVKVMKIMVDVFSSEGSTNNGNYSIFILQRD